MKRKLWLQLVLIFVLSLASGLVYNQLSKTPLPVFQKYVQDTKTDRETGEDLSVYFQEMDVATVEALLSTDMMVLLDARTPDKYGVGHIPGAINCPITTFQESYPLVRDRLQENKSIVIYCIGTDCIDSSLLARELHLKGHRDIYVYKGGITEWQSLGMPVQGAGETSSPANTPPSSEGSRP